MQPLLGIYGTEIISKEKKEKCTQSYTQASV